MKTQIETRPVRREATIAELPGSHLKPVGHKPNLSLVPQRDEEMDVTTQPAPLPEVPADSRLHEAMRVIERDYKRIHAVIRSMWGHHEFGDYIRQLILSGGDGMGQSRVGFKREAVTAMFTLIDLHDAEISRS